MGSEKQDSDTDEAGNFLGRALERIRADLDTEDIREVVNIENGRPKIDPKKAKELANEQNRYSVKGAAGGAIAGAVISVSGVMVIPGAAVGAALGYAIDRNAVDNVEKLEEDFQKVFVAIEEEEEVDLSRLAMITHIKTDTLANDYVPYLEEQGFVEFDEENNVVMLSTPLYKRALSYIRG